MIRCQNSEETSFTVVNRFECELGSMAADHTKSTATSEHLTILPYDDTESETVVGPLGHPLPVSNLSSNSRRQLSRLITQPRAVYESLIDPGSVTSTSDSSLEEVLCLRLQAMDFPGTGCRLPDDDDSQTVNESKLARNEESILNQDDDGQHSSTMASLNILQQNGIWGWTTRYEGRIRLDPHIKRSRHRKLDLMAQLQNLASELEMVVSTLSPQVSLLDHQRWLLHNENDSLKRKIAQISDDLQLQTDENEALERELHWLRGQQRMEDFQRRPETLGPKEEGSKVDGDGPLIVHDGQSEQEERKETSHMIAATTGEGTKSSEQSKTDSSPQESDGNSVKQLVKWPSTLYRSVSAIRKDVLESVNFDNI